jgi:hypothetical protein
MISIGATLQGLNQYSKLQTLIQQLKPHGFLKTMGRGDKIDREIAIIVRPTKPAGACRD